MPGKKLPLVVDDRPPPRKPSARSSAKARRSAARLTAVQILYQSTILNSPSDAVLTEFVDYRIGQLLDDLELVAADRPMLDEIIKGVEDNHEMIDKLLEEILTGTTTVERVEVLLRCILRAGVAELMVHRDIPAPIIISDYVSVTDAFYDGTETKLINAALDAASRRLRPTG